MKRTVTYLFIFFLATLVFYGGAGINIITYCCSDCRIEGTDVLLEDKCCEVHDHDHPPVAENAVSACQTDESSSCDVERISFDWNKSCYPVLDLQPAVVDLLSFGAQRISLVPAPGVCEPLIPEQDSPPIVCPRVYLSLLNSLLI